MTGSLPDLQFLPKLYAFYGDGNQFSGSIPTEYGNLDSLVTLSLTNNDLIGRLPTELGNLGTLPEVEVFSVLGKHPVVVW